MINRCIFAAVCTVLIAGLFIGGRAIFKLISSGSDKKQTAGASETIDMQDYDLSGLGSMDAELEETLEEEEETVRYEAHTTALTTAPAEEVVSEYAIFIDKDSGDILAQRGYNTRISPASMTKVLTLLIAAENVKDLDDSFTISLEQTDYAYSHGCSAVGFAENETVSVRDLMYGTILPSGGDAAMGLACYVAGSHEAFVDMMNDRLSELGLGMTAHFTNCVGLYDEDHYCSVYDMAMIMEAALDNELCREILSAHTYTTSSTDEHPEGITVSNWFLRRIEDKDMGGEVICAKTGYVVESKNCAVSYGRDKSGKEYICCTAGSTSAWRCIYDHVALYGQFANGGGKGAEGTGEGSLENTEDIPEDELSENFN